MGSVFEDMCRYYTLEKGSSGKEDYFITRVGSWWGNEMLMRDDGSRYVQTADIDVVGVSDTDKVIIAGECKFKNKKMSESVYEALVHRCKSISIKYPFVEYDFFSLSGFTDWDPSINLQKSALLYT